MRVALDTDVLLSACKTPLGVCDQLMEEAIGGGIQLCYDSRVLDEYKQVLARSHRGSELFLARLVLARLVENGGVVEPRASNRPLPEEADRPFLEVALAESVDCLVTGDLKRYPESARQGAVVLAPEEFLARYRQSLGSGEPEKPLSSISLFEI
jgi:predicted nucleic acid-binding protein